MPTHEPADALGIYLKEIGQVPLLTRQEEITLARRIRRGDQQARSQMIQANLRLVVKIAHDYDGKGLPLLDLISEGNIGLMKAAERFNPGKGVKFSTYASWWIKQAVRRALSNQSRTIRLPVHITGQVFQLNRLGHGLAATLGREPTTAELAEHLDLPEHRVTQLRTVSRTPTSLDAPVANDGEDGARFGELLEDANAPTAAEMLLTKSARQDIRQQLQHLTPREAEIITLRFGLDGQDPQTLDLVGRRFKVSRERIRQIQDLVLTKLRRRLERLEPTESIGQS